MQELSILHTKLDKLLRQYLALEAERDALLLTIGRQKEEIAELEKRAGQVEEQLNLDRTGEALAGKEDKQAVRKQLNALIGDIDKLLASLND